MSYKTYQEAKMAMPLACIIHDTDNDIFFGMPSREGAILTNDGCKFAEPQDYCMTVEKFLVDGHKFVEGDVYLNSNGRTLGVVNIPEYNNKRSTIDCNLYVLRAAALENQMNDKQETVLATEMSERDIPDFEGVAGIFDACANNEADTKYDDEARTILSGFADIENNFVMFHSDMSTTQFYDLSKSFVHYWDSAIGKTKSNEVDFDSTPQQVESLRTTTKEDYDTGMRDCVKTIASQIGLTFGVDVGYADLPYKLAAYFADLRVDGAVAVAGEWKNGDECHYHSTPNVPSKFVAIHPNNPKAAIIWEGGGDCNLACVAIECLRKPESPQEKAKREREEAINMMVEDFLSCDVESLSEINGKVAKVCLALYDAGYRKGE